MDNNASQTADEIVVLLRTIKMNLKRFMPENLSEYNFTVPQVMVMHQVFLNPNITMTELSNRVILSKSTVSGIVDRLVKQGAIVRERDPEDRRNIKLSLGYKMLNLMHACRSNLLTDVVEGIDREELEKIMYGLRTLAGLLEAPMDGNTNTNK